MIFLYRAKTLSHCNLLALCWQDRTPRVPEQREAPPEASNLLTLRRGTTGRERPAHRLCTHSITPRRVIDQVISKNTSLLNLSSYKKTEQNDEAPRDARYPQAVKWSCTEWKVKLRPQSWRLQTVITRHIFHLYIQTKMNCSKIFNPRSGADVLEVSSSVQRPVTLGSSLTEPAVSHAATETHIRQMLDSDGRPAFLNGHKHRSDRPPSLAR